MEKETTSRASPITSAFVGRVDISSPDRTYLQKAHAWVTDPAGLSKLARCVVCGGSQCTFIARSVIEVLQFEVIDHRDLWVTAFETSYTAHGRRSLVHFNMRGTWTNVSTWLTAFESTHAFSHHLAVPHDIKTQAHSRKMMLADPPGDSDDLSIDILIGVITIGRQLRTLRPYDFLRLS